jgi:hypothetical protein
VVNPYREYPHPISTEGAEELFFKIEDAEIIIKSFQTHPAFAIALENLSEIKSAPPIDYERTILTLESELVEARPGHDAGWLEDFKMLKRVEHPSLANYRHIAALICLRDSLANLNQLIYQALYQEKLIHIDSSITIDYIWSTGGGGIGMWLMYLYMGNFIIIDTGDLVHISTGVKKGDFNKQLFRVEVHHLPPISDPGVLIMRYIDDNLNSYRDLIR